jgi:hypothetical protein
LPKLGNPERVIHDVCFTKHGTGFPTASSGHFPAH